MLFSVKRCPHCGYTPSIKIHENGDTAKYIHMNIECCTESNKSIDCLGDLKNGVLGKRIQNAIDEDWNHREHNDRLLSIVDTLYEIGQLENTLTEDQFDELSSILSLSKPEKLEISNAPSWVLKLLV